MAFETATVSRGSWQLRPERINEAEETQPGRGILRRRLNKHWGSQCCTKGVTVPEGA